MKNLLHIWLGRSPEEPIRWLVLDVKGSKTLESGVIDCASELYHLRSHSLKCKTIILLPGELCLYARVKLPDRSKLAKRTIPYQIEEKLCESVEETHIAIGNVDAELFVPALVMSKNVLSERISSLEKNLDKLDIVTADYMALNSSSDDYVKLEDRNRVLCRSKSYSATLDSASVDAWQVLAHVENKILEFAGDDSESQLDSAISPLEKLAQSLQVETVINLLQGEFEQRNKLKDWTLSMKLPLLIAGLASTLHLGAIQAENQILEGKIDRLDERVEQVFLSALPDTRRVVNPRSQMKAKLAELKSTDNDLFVRLLDKASKPLANNKAVTLQQVRYQSKEGALQIYVQAPDYSVLETLNDHFQRVGLKVQPGAFQKMEDQVISAQITLWERNND